MCPNCAGLDDFLDIVTALFYFIFVKEITWKRTKCVWTESSRHLHWIQACRNIHTFRLGVMTQPPKTPSLNLYTRRNITLVGFVYTSLKRHLKMPSVLSATLWRTDYPSSAAAEPHRSPCRWRHRSRWQGKISAPAAPTQQTVLPWKGQKGRRAWYHSAFGLCWWMEWPSSSHSTAQHTSPPSRCRNVSLQTDSAAEYQSDLDLVQPLLFQSPHLTRPPH